MSDDPATRLREHAKTRRKMTKAELIADAESGDEAYINTAAELEMYQVAYEDLRAAGLLVLQSQRVAVKKRPMALSTALDALRAVIRGE